MNKLLLEVDVVTHQNFLINNSKGLTKLIYVKS